MAEDINAAWALEEPYMPSKASQNDLVFIQIGFLRKQGLERTDVETRLLAWAHENGIGFTDDQLMAKLDWTYRNWDK